MSGTVQTGDRPGRPHLLLREVVPLAPGNRGRSVPPVSRCPGQPEEPPRPGIPAGSIPGRHGHGPSGLEARGHPSCPNGMPRSHYPGSQGPVSLHPGPPGGKPPRASSRAHPPNVGPAVRASRPARGAKDWPRPVRKARLPQVAPSGSATALGPPPLRPAAWTFPGSRAGAHVECSAWPALHR